MTLEENLNEILRLLDTESCVGENAKEVGKLWSKVKVQFREWTKRECEQMSGTVAKEKQ